MELDVRSIDTTKNIFLLSIKGRLKSGYLAPLEKEFNKLNRVPAVKLILEVSGVESIDSSGIGELIKARTEIMERGGRVAILGATSRVEILIKMSGLDNYFPVLATESEAIESVLRPPEPAAEPPAETSSEPPTE